jgi:hypothetical protein
LGAGHERVVYDIRSQAVQTIVDGKEVGATSTGGRLIASAMGLVLIPLRR